MAKTFAKKHNPTSESEPQAIPLRFRKSFKWVDDRWKPITPEELFDTKVGELWHEEKRLMLVCEFNGNTIYVVCNDIDHEAVKKKYPTSCCIHIHQLFRLWNGVMDANYVMNTLPKVMMALTTFEGTKVVDVKRLS